MKPSKIGRLLLEFVISLLTVSACLPRPDAIPSTDFRLSKTYEIPDLGLRIAYPNAWFAGTDGTVTAISELEVDQRRALAGPVLSVNGYQIVLDHRTMGFLRGLGLREGASLSDLLDFNSEYFKFQEPIAVSEAVLFGERALRVRTFAPLAWRISVMGFLNGEAYILTLKAPTEEALDDFISTFNKILDSIEPVED